MWHTVFIAIHTVAAVAALGLGIAALRFPRLLRAHTIGTAMMAGALPFSIAVGWTDRDSIANIVFTGLAVLAIVMFLRAVLAERASHPLRRRAVVSHIGFNLISLVTGFLILPVLRAGAGAIGVILTAVLIPVTGSIVLQLAKRRLPADPTRVG